jgi:hypothetical protein
MIFRDLRSTLQKDQKLKLSFWYKTGKDETSYTCYKDYTVSKNIRIYSRLAKKTWFEDYTVLFVKEDSESGILSIGLIDRTRGC